MERNLILLRGDYPGLGWEEVGVLGKEKGWRVWRREERVVVAEGEMEWWGRRLAWAKMVGRYWFFARSPKEFRKKVRKSGLDRYVVRNSPFFVSGAERGKLGWWLDGEVRVGGKTEVHVVKGRRGYYVVTDPVRIQGKEFEKRDVKNRPFRHPSSLNARLARLLVNLSGVMEGERFLDPFCGAGGILIEAGLVGAEVYGVDRDPRMVEGARRNLEWAGVKGRVEVGDAREVEGEWDCGATDPPYGRSSSLFSEDLEGLYREAFRNLVGRIRKRFVVLCMYEIGALLEGAGWRVRKVGEIRVHGGMRRRIYLCERKED